LQTCEKYKSKVINNNLDLYSSIVKNYQLQSANVNKLKVGFISADFNHHAVATQIIDIFAEIKKSDKMYVSKLSEDTYNVDGISRYTGLVVKTNAKG
jgi:predicted O-linked N-acetylglucosamine transferase (SPINDLY family)